MNTTAFPFYLSNYTNSSSTIWVSSVHPIPVAKSPKGPPPFFYEDVTYKRAFAITSITILSITAIICLLQFILRPKCVPLITTQLSTKAGQLFFCLFMIAFIAFYWHSILFIYFIFNFERYSDDIEGSFIQFVIWSKIPYSIGRLAMMFFFIGRLHYVFRSSVLSISPFILIILTIFSLIEFILGAFTAFFPLYILDLDENVRNALGLNDGAKHLDQASLSIGIILSIIVMIYFIQRLFKITIKTSMKSSSRSLSVSQSNCSDINSSTNDLYLNESQLGFIHTITRTTVLSLIGLLSTVLFHADVLLDFENTDPQKHKAVSSLDGAINTICMYLVFSFAKRQYEVSCKYCHLSIKKCCILIILKWIKTNEQKKAIEMTQNI